MCNLAATIQQKQNHIHTHLVVAVGGTGLVGGEEESTPPTNLEGLVDQEARAAAQPGLSGTAGGAGGAGTRGEGEKWWQRLRERQRPAKDSMVNIFFSKSFSNRRTSSGRELRGSSLKRGKLLHTRQEVYHTLHYLLQEVRPLDRTNLL